MKLLDVTSGYSRDQQLMQSSMHCSTLLHRIHIPDTSSQQKAKLTSRPLASASHIRPSIAHSARPSKTNVKRSTCSSQIGNRLRLQVQIK